MRKGEPGDWPEIERIGKASFSQATAQPAVFRNAYCLIAEHDGAVAGYLLARKVADAQEKWPAEWEVLSVATRANARREGIAEALLRYLIEPGTVYFLEVRLSNIPAINLYKKLGFTQIGERPNYYLEPLESALVMRWK